ncbi:MAG: S8 family peptidase [Inquilinus sp.]|uniref:S8 family peptidase n=1 Tax=Inquilinus sp. TaxID=1932117 RepID=UPI003F41A03C
MEPERIVYALQERALPQIGAPAPDRALSGYSREYLEGYRDAVNNLCDRLIGGGPETAAVLVAFDEAEFTWGLQATRAATSHFTGKGIRVAVLDTGFDPGHPDFAGRTVTMQSFVPGETAQDGHGHGTHCIGTACGPRRPSTLPGYGVASEAEIFAGKVLSNRGSGGDAGILAGIAWAMSNQCAIASMSLGAAVEIGQPHSRVFEQAARRALAAGTLIIAAAGNESQRPQDIRPVGHPANCPSIMAVAAIDRQSRIAPFSCGGLGPEGGQVDIAGPGVAIRSSWPRPVLQRTISGTSMATPHVAGIAALHAQSDPNLRGRALISVLTQTARRMTLPARDVGAGLVQAP